MIIQLRFDKYSVVYRNLSNDFIAGVTAVPYLYYPKTAIKIFKIKCFHANNWQTYGAYDLVRGFIFPFIDPASNPQLMKMIYGNINSTDN